MSRETPDSSRGSRGRNVLDPELTQDYISQVSEEIEGRVTKKLSKEFNKTESRILGALSKLDELFLKPQVRTCSVFQGASRNVNSESREIHGDRSSTGPYPEGGYFPHHSGQLNSSEADMVTEPYPRMVTGVTGEIRHYPHMVTGATEEIRDNPHATTATQEEIPCCSPITSSGKQKKAHSTSQPQFRSENTPSTIEADQILLALQNWRRTPIQPISTIILAESRNCLNLWQRQCLRLTENQGNSNCLKIYSKRVWKSTISWRKKTR